MFKAAGAISDPEMLTFRRFGSRIEGHPLPCSPGRRRNRILGEGLPISVGIAVAGNGWIGSTTDPRACAATPRWPRVRCGGVRIRGRPRPRQPDGHPGRQPPRSDRRDDARLGRGRLSAPRRSRSLEGDRDRRSRRRRDRPMREPSRRPASPAIIAGPRRATGEGCREPAGQAEAPR